MDSHNMLSPHMFRRTMKLTDARRPARSIPLYGWGALFIAAAMPTCGKKEEKREAPPPEVLVTQVQQKEVPVYRDWVATTDGYNNAVVKAKVQGYITSQNYDDGAYVKKGDVLFELDARPFEADLAQAQADLSKSKAQQLQAQSDFERAQKLLPTNAISQQDYDSKNQANQAAIATVQASAAAVQQAQLNLDYTKVTSPIEGIAGIAPVSEGDLVGGASTTTLTTVSTADPIKVLFLISEQEYIEAGVKLEEITKIPMDQRPARLQLTLADGSIFPQMGKLYAVDRNVNTQTGAIQLEGIVPNPGNILRPGQFAKVRIEVNNIKDALLVPQRAIIDTQGQYSVLVVGKDNKAEVRRVKMGDKYGTEWHILSGVSAGETIIVEGTQKARQGMTVNPKPYVPKAPEGESKEPAAKPESSPAPAA